MKSCPRCGKEYADDSLNFCLDDGSRLTAVYGTNVPPRPLFGSQPPKKPFPIVPLLGGVLVAAVLAIAALVAGLYWLGSDSQRDEIVSNTNAQRTASPNATPQSLKSSPTPPQNPPWNNTNSTPTAAPDSTPEQGADFSKGLNYSGKATNITTKKTSGVTFSVISRDGVYYADADLDNVNLFGRLRSMEGKKTTCPKEAPADSLCIQFSGSLLFGDDGSGFPRNTKAPFAMLLIFDSTAQNAAGAYQIAKIPKYTAAKQLGAFQLSRSR